MRSTISAAAGLVWLGLVHPAWAGGDAALGQYLAATCATCHQGSGRQLGGIPAITGHPPDQFVDMMQAYKTGRRDNQAMAAIAVRLTRDEIEALAAYYGGLGPQP